MAQNEKIKTVIKNGEEPQPIEILESSIIEIAKGFKVLSKTRVKQETLVTLLHDYTKVSKVQIRYVLNCLSDLENLFLRNK
jgi:hypothetical protein